MITPELVRETLSSVKYPGFTRDIVSFGLVKDVRVNGTEVIVQMTLTTNDPKIPQAIKAQSEAALCVLPGIGNVAVRIDIQAPAGPATAGGTTGAAQIEGVRHVIAVASGKGGVGKSTVAANLAIALQKSGASVGLCDCDMYGPSMGLMFGTNERPLADEETNRITPVERYGLRVMSMGFLLDDASPAILRGPDGDQIHAAVSSRVDWGPLDFLILDLPPGTGDIQLTIVQTVALTGALIVTTPQEVALIDARKAATMFQKVNVPVLGLIENMSYFLCPSDGVRYDIFGEGGGEREAARLRVPMLGQIPIDIATREAGDRGLPVTVGEPDGAVAKRFANIASQLRQSLMA